MTSQTARQAALAAALRANLRRRKLAAKVEDAQPVADTEPPPSRDEPR